MCERVREREWLKLSFSWAMFPAFLSTCLSTSLIFVPTSVSLSYCLHVYKSIQLFIYIFYPLHRSICLRKLKFESISIALFLSRRILFSAYFPLNLYIAFSTPPLKNLPSISYTYKKVLFTFIYARVLFSRINHHTHSSSHKHTHTHRYIHTSKHTIPLHTYLC